MRRQIENYCLKVAASDLTAKDLRAAAAWIEENGADALVNTVMHLRDVAHNAISDNRTRSRRRPRARTESVARKQAPRSSTAARVQRLLKHEGRLPVAQAASLLLPRLEAALDCSLDQLQPRPKEGYERWVQRLASAIPEPLLLHEVTKLRNAKVHAPSSDWPLQHPPRSKDQVVAELRYLLKTRAGLTVAEAAKELLSELQTELVVVPEEARARPREGFERWLCRLLRHVPADVLLKAMGRVVTTAGPLR